MLINSSFQLYIPRKTKRCNISVGQEVLFCRNVSFLSVRLSLNVTVSLCFVCQGGEGALDPGEIRAASVPGVTARHRPVSGPAAAEGDGRGGPSLRRPAARPRVTTAGQRDLRRRRRTQLAAPGQPQGQRGHHAAPHLGKTDIHTGVYMQVNQVRRVGSGVSHKLYPESFIKASLKAPRDVIKVSKLHSGNSVLYSIRQTRDLGFS